MSVWLLRTQTPPITAFKSSSLLDCLHSYPYDLHRQKRPVLRPTLSTGNMLYMASCPGRRVPALMLQVSHAHRLVAKALVTAPNTALPSSCHLCTHNAGGSTPQKALRTAAALSRPSCLQGRPAARSGGQRQAARGGHALQRLRLSHAVLQRARRCGRKLLRRPPRRHLHVPALASFAQQEVRRLSFCNT